MTMAHTVSTGVIAPLTGIIQEMHCEGDRISLPDQSQSTSTVHAKLTTLISTLPHPVNTVLAREARNISYFTQRNTLIATRQLSLCLEVGNPKLSMFKCVHQALHFFLSNTNLKGRYSRCWCLVEV